MNDADDYQRDGKGELLVSDPRGRDRASYCHVVEEEKMSDLISRLAAIDAVNRAVTKEAARWSIQDLPSAEPELHYCRECKWNRCHINVDKHGKSEIYWWCLNWDGGTDEEGYCYEWERRTDG